MSRDDGVAVPARASAHSGVANQANVEATIGLPLELLDAIADRVAERLADRLAAAQVSPYLTVAEAAEYLRRSEQRIYDLRSQGRLEAVRDGRRVLFERAALDAALDREGSA